MKKENLLYILSIVLVSISLTSGVFLVHEVLKRNREIEYIVPITPNTTTNTEYPTRIRIESINIDLPIQTVEIKDEWAYTDEGVLYVKESGELISDGNKIFYGHNYPNLLKNLRKTQPGDIIEVYIGDRTYVYKVSSVLTVTPDQTHIIDQTYDNRITIFTCTGFLDSKRLVVTAIKES